MKGQNRPVVTDEPVEFEKLTGCHSRLQEINQSFYRDPWNIPRITKETPKDHNMKPVGVGNTLARIWADYAQKAPRTLHQKKLDILHKE